MRQYLKVVFFSWLLILAGSVAFAGDRGLNQSSADNQNERISAPGDIASKFEEIRHVIYHVFKFGIVVQILNGHALLREKKKKILTPFNQCQGVTVKVKNLNACMHQCDETKEKGDKCIGVRWNKEKKECFMLRYVLQGKKNVNEKKYKTYMHKDRVTKFTRPSDVKWFWPYSVTVSYDKELDPTYFGMMNSVFGKLINVKPAAAEKITSSGKYELKCKKSDKICISHLKS